MLRWSSSKLAPTPVHCFFLDALSQLPSATGAPTAVYLGAAVLTLKRKRQGAPSVFVRPPSLLLLVAAAHFGSCPWLVGGVTVAFGSSDWEGSPTARLVPDS